ncbi:MAG: alpha/beta fold hydrolase [Gemmatimonadaceae bacterium]|nr:alpha/beta fold hydrolase [Gemmatimonadaceae bacterium]
MTRGAVRRAVVLSLGALSLSACVLRPTLTDTFGFKPKQMKRGRAAPSEWGWDAASLDTIARLDSAGGLLAWWGAAPTDSAPCGGALLLHGKGRNRAEMMPLGKALQAKGFSVLIPDYRGYGGTEGTPTTVGLYDDAGLAYRSLRTRLSDSTLPIVVVGHSLGTALAARVSRDYRPAATVYMSPFARISSAVRSRFGAIGPRLFDTTAFAFNPLDDAAQAGGRTMVVVAGRDLLIPRSESDAFIAGLGLTAVVRDPKATHNGLLDSELAIAVVADSMERWSGCAARRSGM